MKNVEHKNYEEKAMQNEKIELVLLPPKEEREVTNEEVAEAYAKLITLLLSGDI